jgi:dipeptidyl aminopeptidase/acylaminoacyl peptidase
MQEQVTFQSAGLKLAGILHLPDGPPRRHPAFLMLHGFGSNKASRGCVVPAELLASWGYAVLRFDMRGCGDSEGERARVICLEQVEDTSSAVSYLRSRPDIDPDRIGCMGTSFGAAVTVYAAGVDPRIAAAISCCGWGDGDKKFRGQHAGPQAWARFSAMMEEGRRKRAAGEVLMVPRFDIVPIKPELRGHLAPGSIMAFPFDTVDSMFSFRANEVVGRIAPRPLLLLHGARDSVTPTEQSIDLFGHAGEPADLHLIAGVDHFMLADNDPFVMALTRGWLDKHFPAR